MGRVGRGGAGRGYPLSDAGLVTTAHWHHGTMAPGPRAAPTLLPRWPRVERWVVTRTSLGNSCGSVAVFWSSGARTRGTAENKSSKERELARAAQCVYLVTVAIVEMSPPPASN